MLTPIAYSASGWGARHALLPRTGSSAAGPAEPWPCHSLPRRADPTGDGTGDDGGTAAGWTRASQRRRPRREARDLLQKSLGQRSVPTRGSVVCDAVVRIFGVKLEAVA